MTMPWERTPEEIRCCPDGCQAIDGGHECAAPYLPPPEQPPYVPPERSLEDAVKAIQADVLFAVRHTAILVRSNNALLRMVANTERGQSMPAGGCTFTDGSTVEFQDVGMPQVNVPLMTVPELVQAVLHKALEIGLEIA